MPTEPLRSEKKSSKRERKPTKNKKRKQLEGKYGLELFQEVMDSLGIAARCFSGYEKLSDALKTTQTEIETGKLPSKPAGIPLLSFPVSSLVRNSSMHGVDRVEIDLRREPPVEREVILESLMRSLFRTIYKKINSAGNAWNSLISMVREAASDEDIEEYEADSDVDVDSLISRSEKLEKEMYDANDEDEDDEDNEEEEDV